MDGNQLEYIAYSPSRKTLYVVVTYEYYDLVNNSIQAGIHTGPYKFEYIPTEGPPRNTRYVVFLNLEQAKRRGIVNRE